MTALQTLTVVLEVDNDGEFVTKIKSADGVLKDIGTSADKAVKSVNGLSSSFAKNNGTLSTFTTKLGTNLTALEKAMKGADNYAGAVERAQQSVAGLHASVSGLTAALKESTNALKKFSTGAKDVASSVRTIAQNAGKGAAGVTSLGNAAKKSSTNINSFVTAASGVSNAVTGWSRKANASGTAIETLGTKISATTTEARNLRDELNAIQSTRGGAAANSVAASVKNIRTSGGNTGFSVGEASARKYATSVERVNEALNKSSSAHSGFIKGITNAAFAIDEVSQAFGIMREVFDLGVGKIIEVNAHTEKLITTLKGLSVAATDAGRSAEALQEYNQIFSIAQRSPFSLDRLADGFVKLKSGNVQDPAGSLKATSDALAHFSASDQQFESAMLAIMQMSGKGVVSMEELRRQLGEAMPTAMRDLASAMQVTIPQLDKMVSTGSLQSQKAIQLLMDEFNRMYGGSSEQKMKTFSGQVALVNTSLQKLALTSGGMGMDGKYGPNSFYTETTRAIEALNKALQSPEAQQAARNLNDILASTARTVSSLINFFSDYGLSIGSLAVKIGEVVLAFKAMNLAIKAASASMAAMEGSAFLQNSGIMSGIMGIGSKNVIKKDALGATIKTAEKTPGMFSKVQGVVSGVAEQGVFGTATAAAGKALSSLAAGFTETAAAEGVFTAALVTGASVLSGTILVVGGLVAAWAAYEAIVNSVTPKTNLLTKAVQNLSQGDVSDKTIAAAKSEVSSLDERLSQMRESYYHAGQSGTFKAQSYGNVNGVGAVNGGSNNVSWFGRLLGHDSKWLEAGSEEAEEYRSRMEAAIQLVQSEDDRAKAIIKDAPGIALDRKAEEDYQNALSNVNILMRQPESEYAKRRASNESERLRLSNNTDDASRKRIGEINDDDVDNASQEATARMNLVKNQIDVFNREAEFAKKAGDTSGYNEKIKVVNKLSDQYKSLSKSLEDSIDRIGKFDLTTAGKAVDRENRNAKNWLDASRDKVNSSSDALSEGFYKSNAESNVKAWISDGGKWADLGSQMKADLTQMAQAVDLVNAKTKNWKDSLQAVNNIQNSIKESAKSFQSSYSDLTTGDSPLGKVYANKSAAIDADTARAVRGFDIDSSGLNPDTYDQVVSSVSNVSSSFKEMQSSVSAAFDSLNQTSQQTSQMSGNIDIMRQTTDAQTGSFTDLNSALAAYELSAQNAGRATFDLNKQIEAINAGDVAKKVAAASAAMQAINNGIANARARKESAEDPSKRLADKKIDLQKSFEANRAALSASLNDPAAISSLAKGAGLSEDQVKAQLKDALNNKNEQYLKDMTGTLGLEYTKSTSRGSSRSNPVDKIKEQVAALKAELDGTDPTTAKFTQRMSDMGKPIDATTKSILAQREALQQQVNAQKEAIQSAKSLIHSGRQKEDESVAQVDSLSLGDSDRVAGQIARIRAQYQREIANVQKKVINPTDRSNLIGGLQANQQGSVDSAISQNLERYQRQSRSIRENLMDTAAERKQYAQQNLNNDVAVMNEEIAKTGWTEGEKRAAYETTAEYYKAKMDEISRSNETALDKTMREWSDWDTQVQNGISSTMDSFVSTMADQLVTGSANWKQFGQNILKMLAEVELKFAMSKVFQMIGGGSSSGGSGILSGISGIAKGLGGIFGIFGGGAEENPFSGAGISASGHHSGGIVGIGEQTFTRSLPSSVFEKAKKYHTGGLAGDEVPAVLQKGEGVFTKGQMGAIGKALNSASESANMATAALVMSSTQKSNSAFDAKSISSGNRVSSSPNIVMNISNQSGTPMKAQTSQPKWDGESWVIDTVIKHAQRPGGLRTALKGV